MHGLHLAPPARHAVAERYRQAVAAWQAARAELDAATGAYVDVAIHRLAAAEAALRAAYQECRVVGEVDPR